jgi:superoxide dismutase, Fe-Mn family
MQKSLLDLFEVTKEDMNPELKKYRLYCDMDGVLCDFKYRFEYLFGKGPREIEAEKGAPYFWGMIRRVGAKFWSGMPWTPSGRQLWSAIKGYDPKLLTAPPRAYRDFSNFEPTAVEGKTQWAGQNLGLDSSDVIFKRSKDKQEIALKDVSQGFIPILIDDRRDNISNWVAAGGIGIHHPENTSDISPILERLRKLYKEEPADDSEKEVIKEQVEKIKFKQPALNYRTVALEPYIDKETMEEHYGKHFKGYTDKLNAELKEKKIIVEAEDQIEAIQKILGKYSNNDKIRNNGGGFYNHVLYFENMTPTYKAPSAKLRRLLEEHFNSFSEFKQQFKDAGLKQFGSGWVFLVEKRNKLVIESYANQDNPYLDNQFKGTILLAMDVWEHSYYLKHRSRRESYINDFLRVIDYSVAEGRSKLLQKEDERKSTEERV